MTKTLTEKVSAGYFDANRQSPIFVGDVYKEQGAMIPYHKVIKDDEKGFMVEHVGTTEKFLLKNDAKNLVKKTYLGNIYDTPDWDELTRGKDVVKAESETTAENTEVKDESIPEDAPADVKEFLNGETDKLPEGTEFMSQAEAEELEKQAKEIEKATNEDSSEVKAPDDTDAVVTPDATTGPTGSPEEKETTETVENNTETDEKSQKTEENNENQEKSNRPVPEVIANSKEEKRLLERRNDYTKSIENLKRKIDELTTEAVRYENLASTLTFEPFVELKMIVSNAVQDNAKKQDIKECKKHLKNYEAIDSMEDLLKEYKELADKNRQNIELTEKEIDDYEIKITEINSKLTNFQTKLFDADTVAKQTETDSESEDNSKDTETTENEQPAETTEEPKAETPETDSTEETIEKDGDTETPEE